MESWLKKTQFSALNPPTLEEALEAIEQLRIVVAAQQQVIEELKRENEALRERLNLNSENSSKPPSSDFKKKKRKMTKKGSGRKRGGQRGHQGRSRKLLPADKVDQIKNCLPAEHCGCGGQVITTGKYIRHQVYELPEVNFTVIEYRLQQGRCNACNSIHTGALPEGVSKSMFGPNMHSMIGLLTTKYRLSKRLVQNILKDLYHFNLSLGSVSNVEGRVSQSLENCHTELKTYIGTTKGLRVNMDETGHYECNIKHWMWVAATKLCTLFVARASRGKKVAKELLGNSTEGFLISDRYCSYNIIPAEKRQLCWAHLKRDLKKISERSGAARRVGDELLFYRKQISKLWKRFKSGEIARHQLYTMTGPLRRQFEQSLEKGIYCGHTRTEQTCKNIFRDKAALWTYIEEEDVEPTNNFSEQQLRPYVIGRKLSFGTQSPRGSRFLERALSCVMTCKQQGLDPLEFIRESVYQLFSGKDGPSLLPLLTEA